MQYNPEEFKKPTYNQREILTRRNLDPANYLVVKDTRMALYVWDLRLCKVKRIQKWN